MNKIFSLIVMLVTICNASAQLRHPSRDAQDRHEIPRGFVVITSDGMGEVFYTEADYQRMARLGSNFQVIRIDPTKLGSKVDSSVTQEYLLKLDSLVNLGRNVGIKSALKLTVYGMEDFSWENFWSNKHNLKEQHIDRWKILWERYKSDDFVVGYDLLNEPRKMSFNATYTELTNNHLVPYYEQVIDEAVKYNPDKLFYCQSIFVNKGEQEEHMQYSPIEVPINRKNVVFTPHTYKNVVAEVAPTMDMFDQNSEVMGATMFVGEWGFPTYNSTDRQLNKQFDYIELYLATANEFDRLGCGSIKAWFTGSRRVLPDDKFTWSMFQDQKAVGSYERKYIMDIIARPYPQVIAGDIYQFNFDYAKRLFSMELMPDNKKGASSIYVSADRFYPDGFTIEFGSDIILSYDPMKNVGLEVKKNEAHFDVSNFIWDSAKQRFVILMWPCDGSMTHIKIYPGIY
ncbi:MAG: cellulase family glycosylhydrolase [Rikenellaceae bacterium]